VGLSAHSGVFTAIRARSAAMVVLSTGNENAARSGVGECGAGARTRDRML
jgi:hypothetical protein